MSNIVKEFLIPGTNKGLFYGGQFQASTSGSEITVLDPAKGTPFTTVPNGSAEDIRAAVSAARTAFPAWAGLDALDRGRYLRAFAEVIRQNIPLLAVLESRITGRAVREMNAQMSRIPEWLEYYAGIAPGLEGEANYIKGDYVTLTQYEPLGPTALLTPWNHPVLILVKKLSAALAAGNTCVIKPSELAPVSPLVIAALATQAGLPDGVVNVITGDATTGEALCVADDIHFIDLTGGTSTGRKVASVKMQILTRQLQASYFLRSLRLVRPVLLDLALLCTSLSTTNLHKDWLKGRIKYDLVTRWTKTHKWVQLSVKNPLTDANSLSKQRKPKVHGRLLD